ncbi:MAG: putative malate transporter [Herbinix sp.]|nr:putative malate transporter [Herbinix sp.]
MNNIILAFSVVFPLMLQMSIGYFLRRKKVTDTHSLNVMNKLVFRVFLPLLLFLNIYSLEPEEAITQKNGMLLLLSSLSVIVIVIIMHSMFPLFIKDKKKCSVIIQGIFRSNLVLFGIPIAASIYGDDRIGIVSLLAAFIVPLFNVLAVIVLEYYRGSKVNYKNVFLNIIKNPLIIASAIAFLLLILRIRIPELILSPISGLSKVATPLAFVVLGGTFQFSRISVNLKYLLVVVLGKLILFPMLVFGVAIALGFRNEALVALIGVTASPTAVSSFTMALEMDADGELAGQVVIFTSIISIITIFFLVYLLKTLQLI